MIYAEEDEDAMLYHMAHAERLQEEASNLETPYDEVVSSFDDVPGPVIPSKPATTIGPIVKSFADVTDDRTVKLIEN